VCGGVQKRNRTHEIPPRRSAIDRVSFDIPGGQAMRSGDPLLDHLFRRVGFGASSADLQAVAGMSYSAAVDYFLEFERQPDDVDSKIGLPESVGITARGPFSPNTNIEDARQRWLFRMVHTRRPLQEKMALFWHNHFGVGYSKVAGTVGALVGTKMMANKSGETPGPQGHYELVRQMALGKFRDLLIAVAQDPAMVVFLDGRTNVRARPQENFGREVMELFTWGLGHYVEADVYAAARVFTGWNLRNVPGRDGVDPAAYQEFIYNSAQHEPTAKTFTFSINGGSTTIPARAATSGMQDGIDFLTSLANHPETARRLARKLWNFFVSDLEDAPTAFVEGVTDAYVRGDTDMRAVLRYILNSRWFTNPGNFNARYSWPAEFVVRTIKEIGWAGFSVDTARVPLTNMGQTLFEPPNVAGWQLGRSWFGTGAMLARMNFAAAVASNQKFNLARSFSAADRAQAARVLDGMLQRLTPAPFVAGEMSELLNYLNTGGPWTGSDAQMNAKAPGLARLVAGSGEYQFV
jgi:uncharacterized protein (DUF1800 family)